jgi:hypothetical protein
MHFVVIHYENNRIVAKLLDYEQSITYPKFYYYCVP